MMSAHRVFQRAFVHAQLLRPPDDYPLGLTSAQWDELSPDCQAFIEILNAYGMDDNVGLFIYRTHPQLAAKISPALKAGLEPLNTRLKHKTEFIDNYVIELAQTALNGLEESNPQPATPRAENKSTPQTTVPTSTIKSEAEPTVEEYHS